MGILSYGPHAQQASGASTITRPDHHGDLHVICAGGCWFRQRYAQHIRYSRFLLFVFHEGCDARARALSICWQGCGRCLLLSQRLVAHCVAHVVWTELFSLTRVASALCCNMRFADIAIRSSPLAFRYSIVTSSCGCMCYLYVM